MSNEPVNKKKPNIVFILTDDQRHDTIQALGNPEIHTPVLDSLVHQGTAFTSAFIPGGTCPAVCMPSRAMIHTGRRLFSFPDHGETLPSEYPLLGECLRDSGYDTYGIGKWHNGPESFQRSFANGDEIFFGGMWDHWNVPAYRYQPNGDYHTKVPYVTNAFNSNQVTFQLSDHVSPGCHSTDLFTDAAINWLDTKSSANPYFMYVSFIAPHDPRTMPKKYMDMYNPDDLLLEPAFMTTYPFETGVASIRDEGLAIYPRTEAEARKHKAEYYAMISHLDDGIGKILQKIESMGDLEHTIIVLAGDNGLALSNHGLYGKQSCFDHSVRVPLIFAGPGIPKDQKSQHPCYLFDIMPTLFELCDLPIPPTVEGSSLCPSLTGNKPSLEWNEKEFVYLAYGDFIRGIRSNRFKLIEYRLPGSNTQLLFDLEKDPSERFNLIYDPNSKEILEELRLKLFEHRDLWHELDHPSGKEFWQ